MKLSFLWIILVGLLVACQTKSTVKVLPSSLVHRQIEPEWINNPPQDSHLYLYGFGEAATKKAAIQEALADLAAKLGVTVSSQFKTELRVKQRGYEAVERDSEKKIVTEVQALTLNQYQIEDVYVASPMQVSVLIKTNKSSLYAAYQRELEAIVKTFKANQATYIQAGQYKRYQLASDEQQRYAAFHRKLLIAKTLSPSMDMTPYLRYEKQVMQQYQSAKAALSFRVSYSDKQSRAFSRPISNALAQVNLLKQQANSVQVNVKVLVEYSYTNGFYIGRYRVSITDYEGATLIGGRQFNLKGMSLQSRAATQRRALNKFTQMINEKGYWYTLGLNPY